MLDFEAVCAGLSTGKGGAGWMLGWLSGTWTAPERFHEALFSYAQAKCGGRLRSRRGVSYDLYHDLVLAHADPRRAAVATYEASGSQQVSYDSLHVLGGALATSWQGAGVETGQSMCVVAPAGLELAVAVVTAFRMGLVLSVLPPLGPVFVQTRLDALDPDHVAASASFEAMLGARAKTALPVTAGTRVLGTRSPSSFHSYGAADPALEVLPHMREAVGEPITVSASRLHEALLRDALLIYALDPGQTVAAPGVDPVQLQPQTLLATLMAGATWLELDARDPGMPPGGLDRATLLGVSPALRETLLRTGVDPARNARAWFHSLADVLDPAWDELSRLFSARKVRGFRVLSNPGSGGVQLFGSRNLEAPGFLLWPAPGERWQLSQVGAGAALSALGDSGVYTVLQGEDGEEDPSMGRVLLGKLEDAYVYGGSLDYGPNARPYPAAEVESVAERHTAVRHAAAVVLRGRWLNEGKAVLILFVEPPGATPSEHRAWWGEVAREVRALVAREVGPATVPDRVEVYPLRPLLDADGKVDSAWCRSRYLSGSLARRARSPLSRTLARLSYILAPPSSPG
jgi:hypothetical protein